MKFKFKPDTVTSAHTTFSVWVGRQEWGSLALCGRLTMRNEEYAQFVRILLGDLGPGVVEVVDANFGS